MQRMTMNLTALEAQRARVGANAAAAVGAAAFGPPAPVAATRYAAAPSSFPVVPVAIGAVALAGVAFLLLRKKKRR